MGQARMLAEVFGDALRYSPATDFICYNGDYWQESKPGSQAVAHELTDLQLDEASRAVARAWKVLEGNGVAEILAATSKKRAVTLMNQEQLATYETYARAATYHGFVMKYHESENIAYTLKEARPILQISPSELDTDGYLLCTPDATYDLRKGLDGAREHGAGDFMTKVTSLSPGNAGYDIWQDALNTFFCSDQALIEYVQRVAGLACIGRVFMANGAVYAENGSVRVIHARKLDALEDRYHAGHRRLERWADHRGGDAPGLGWARTEPPAGRLHADLVRLTWSLELYQQANARLWCQGQQDSRVVIHHIVAKNTVDETVIAALARKETTQSALIDAVKANLQREVRIIDQTGTIPVALSEP